MDLRDSVSMRTEIASLIAGWTTIGVATAVERAWLGTANPTIVALSFVLIVLIVAAVSTRRARNGFARSSGSSRTPGSAR